MMSEGRSNVVSHHARPPAPRQRQSCCAGHEQVMGQHLCLSRTRWLPNAERALGRWRSTPRQCCVLSDRNTHGVARTAPTMTHAGLDASRQTLMTGCSIQAGADDAIRNGPPCKYSAISLRQCRLDRTVAQREGCQTPHKHQAEARLRQRPCCMAFIHRSHDVPWGCSDTKHARTATDNA